VSLVAERGKPFSRKGFRQSFRKQCDRTGLPHCTAHGLRGREHATAHQLKAIFWLKHAEATRGLHTGPQNNALAEGAMSLLVTRKNSGQAGTAQGQFCFRRTPVMGSGVHRNRSNSALAAGDAK
jgi:hypothetical protein